ncbi:MAG: hypothetical protein ACRDV9_14390 [Acidimicrobiia bacterium]
MTRLTTVGGLFAARVLEARLRAEGIGVELRGALDGPYQFTVGSLSQVDVYVPPADLEDARLVLIADEIDAVFTEAVFVEFLPEETGAGAANRDQYAATRLIGARHIFWLVITALVLSGLAPILHLALNG